MAVGGIISIDLVQPLERALLRTSAAMMHVDVVCFMMSIPSPSSEVKRESAEWQAGVESQVGIPRAGVGNMVEPIADVE
jgi:hypothetical protein